MTKIRRLRKKTSSETRDPSTIYSTFGVGAYIGSSKKGRLETKNATFEAPEIAVSGGHLAKKLGFAKIVPRARLHSKIHAFQTILSQKPGSDPQGPFQRPQRGQNGPNAISQGTPRRPQMGAMVEANRASQNREKRSGCSSALRKARRRGLKTPPSQPERFVDRAMLFEPSQGGFVDRAMLFDGPMSSQIAFLDFGWHIRRSQRDARTRRACEAA